MKILDQLIKIDKLPAKNRKTLIKLVMSNNAIFGKYVELCYTGEPRDSINIKKLKYTPTESPMGMDYGSLESVYSKFYQTVYDNGLITDESANLRLIQIFEITSKIEVDFLKSVINGRIVGFTKKDYDTLTSEV